MKSSTLKRIELILLTTVTFVMLHSFGSSAHADSQLLISEVMPQNSAFLAEENEFYDWIELVNNSDEPVDLTGYGLSDKMNAIRWSFPQTEIAAHGFLAVKNIGFGISGAGETVYLFDSEQSIIDRFECPDSSDDISFVKNNGIVYECRYPTPGYPNTPEGYMDYQRTIQPEGLLLINEVVTATNVAMAENGTECDWVELKNVSGESIKLSEYSLADCAAKEKQRHYRLPDKVLEPGGMILLYCSDKSSGEGYTGFALDSEYDGIFLYHEDTLADYASLKNIPVGGSLGRMNGEMGFFYFSNPSPLAENRNGFPFVSEKPQASVKEGIFDKGGFSVELSGNGDVFYTLDGSIPTENSQKYSAPIRIDRTTIIRAVSREDNSVQSNVSTFSYIVDKSTLPVISLVFDDFEGFEKLYGTINNNTPILKKNEYKANIAFFDGDKSFSISCGAHMRGYTSLKDPKKSIGVYFRDRYGADALNYDVFENGITKYSSLLLRVGQDYNFTYIRNELFQELCQEMTDKVSTQAGRYCTLFINGNYWGLYCLKEDFSSQYYASHFNVSKDSVERQKAPVPRDSDFYKDVFLYALVNSLSTEEGYRHICSVLDIDSLIDWMILEGVSGNTDTVHNVSFFRSKELDNKWRISFYDLDWALWYEFYGFENIINGAGNSSYEMTNLIQRLLKNEEFAAKFLERFYEVNKTVLSNEHILEKIDELAERIAPEVPRDQKLWTDHSDSHWPTLLQRMKDMITGVDWEERNQRVITANVNGAKEFFAGRMTAESGS